MMKSSLLLLQILNSSGRNLIVTGSKDNTVKLWDSESTSCIGAGIGHMGAVGAIAFSKKKNRTSLLVAVVIILLRCKSYEKAKKKLTVLEVPNILTIVLKQFQSGNFEKLNKSVQFPEVLNMAPYISGLKGKSPLYRLYAVVVHLNSMNDAYSGHYVCYVKNIQGEWFRTDDSRVEPVELSRVLSERAYMLLYARHSPKPLGSVSSNVVFSTGKFKRGNLEAIPDVSKTRSNSMAKPMPQHFASERIAPKVM
ncbi:hypothetical protein KIW84_020170 [Lathyrus oleraceus]|uniref:USP domain-containing protein n=1 Tax=Pisum sativum TaxID=3888 RepID=A0A9D4Y4D4_PEA|nr:hypothetical protein KIW84_020170 [Pisum sativum]